MPEWLVPITEVLPIDLWLAVALSCAALSAFVALEKKRDPLSWMAWGAVTGPIALLALAACPSRSMPPSLFEVLMEVRDDLGSLRHAMEQAHHELIDIRNQTR